MAPITRSRCRRRAVDTLITKYNLGDLLLNAGDRARARPLFEEAAAGWAAALGGDPPAHTERPAAACAVRPQASEIRYRSSSARGDAGRKPVRHR